ncbi:MAG: hypothetical protein UY63_C0017G0013 [Parcubacteria group bacterium GW2011_GWA2_51_10]|nr:MAG: hypothetical protein UY63_C0017G0013 [Parcubacteria group bacterium GW2011_GWA2_51_10]
MTRSSRLGFLFVISFALFIVIVFSIPAKAQAFCFLGYGNTCPKETEEITRDQALDTYCQWLISDGSFGKNLGTCTTEMADTFEYPRVQYCFSQHPNDMQAFDSCWADGGDTPGNDPFLAESRALDRSLYSSFPVDEALARSRALDRNTPSSGLFGPSAGKDKFQIADEYQDAVNAGLPQAEVDARFKAVMAGPKSAAPLPRGFQIKPAAPSTVPAVPSAQPDIDYATNQSFQQACALEDPIGSRAYNSCLNRLYQTYLGGNPLRSTAPQQTFPTGLDSGADFESAASPSTGKRAGGIIEQAKPSRRCTSC